MRGKPVLAAFDQILKRASELVATRNESKPPKRQSLNPAEIQRMTEHLFGKMLADDETARFGSSAFRRRATS